MLFCNCIFVFKMKKINYITVMHMFIKLTQNPFNFFLSSFKTMILIAQPTEPMEGF